MTYPGLRLDYPPAFMGRAGEVVAEGEDAVAALGRPDGGSRLAAAGAARREGVGARPGGPYVVGCPVAADDAGRVRGGGDMWVEPVAPRHERGDDGDDEVAAVGVDTRTSAVSAQQDRPVCACEADQLVMLSGDPAGTPNGGVSASAQRLPYATCLR